MDSLLITFLTVLLAECGNRPQRLSAVLAVRYEGNRRIWLAVLQSVAINALVAAFAGSFIDEIISEDPVRLFVALAYIFAAISMLWRQRQIDLLDKWTTGPFWTSFLGIFILQFGDRAQFLVLAQAAQSQAWGFTALGGFLGSATVILAGLFFREKLAEIMPIDTIRRISGAFFLIYGVYLALVAWRLL